MKHRIFTTSLIAIACVVLSGCDGGAFPDVIIQVSAGDTTTDGTTDGDGTTSPNIPAIPGTSTPVDTSTTGPFEATWFAAFKDDFVDSSLATGFTNYVVRMTLNEESNGSVTGTGTMYRTFLSVPAALEEVPFSVDGFKRGENDAQLTFTANSATDFELDPIWQLRFGSSRLVGVYAETDATSTVVRTGHATWHKVSANPTLQTRWAGAWEDTFGTTAFPRRERLASVTLNRSDANQLSGSGQFTEARPLDVVEQFTFDVTRGEARGSFADPTFGNLDLAGNEYDWVGFFNGAQFAGAYAQRGAGGGVVRWGHTEMTPSEDVTPSTLAGQWVSSFSDSNAPDSATPRDYLALLVLQTGGGNTILAERATVLDQHRDPASLQAYTFSNGQLVGNRFTFRLTTGARQFDWDCHVTEDRIFGIYTITNTTTNAFVGRGHAEWHKRSTASNYTGGWMASYLDTINTTGRRQTQYIRINIANQDSAGKLTGTGILRFAGEDGDRTFALTGQIGGTVVTMTFSGAGLSGDMTWRFRRTATGMFAVYENLTTADTRESRGVTFFRRTDSN